MKPKKIGVNKEITLFFLLTYVISWSIWGSIILFPETLGEMYFLIIFGAFGPFASATILTRKKSGKEEAKKWLKNILQIRKHFRWHLIGGLGIPFIIALLHISIYQITQGLPLLQTEPPWYWLLPAIPINIFIVFIYSSAFGEEPGWQGYAMPRLLQQYNPLSSILILSFLWALWHLPLSYVPIWKGNEPMHLMFLYTPALAVITTWLTQKSDGSVMPAVFLHYATNLYGSYLLGTEIFIEPLDMNFTMIKTAIYWLIAIILLLQTHGALGNKRTPIG